MHLDRFKGNRWDGVGSDLMVHAEAELITDHTGEEMDWNGMVT